MNTMTKPMDMAGDAPAMTTPTNGIKPAYLEALTLVERLHRRLLDVVKDEFERNGRDEINAVKISESLEKYIIELVFASRNPAEYKLEEEANYIMYGASPRASINLNLAAKAVAFFDEREYVLPEDIKEIATDVMNHRIILNYEAEADGVKTQDIIEAILHKVPISK